MNLLHRTSAGKRRLLAGVAAAALLASLPAPAPGLAAEATLIRFEIADQFDRPHSDADFRGRLLVLVGSDRKGSRYQGAWVRELRALIGERGSPDAVRLIEAADLRGVPFFVKGSVKRKFPSDERQWVLMDWKGMFARAYEFEPDACSVLLFDRGGELLHRAAGQDPDRKALAEIGRLIDSRLPAQR